MINRLANSMLKATDLTRAGRLAAATDFIQRVLHDNSREPPVQDAARDPIEVMDTIRPRLDMDLRGQPAGISAIPQLTIPLRGLLDRMNRSGLQVELGDRLTQSPTQTRESVPAGGQFLERSYRNHAGYRPYKLYIPRGHRGEAVPLIVMLHGCTQSPDDFAAGTRMNEMAEEHTFLVVYPAQIVSANASKCWNWFHRNHQNRGCGEPELIAGITREVMAEYRVEPKRVYIAGMSAGGAAAAIMGVTYPDLYAAIGVHSGLAYGSACDLPSAFAAMRNGRVSPIAEGPWLLRKEHGGTATNQRATPTIVFHGDQDKTVHPSNGDEILTQFGPAYHEMQTTVKSGPELTGYSYSRTRRCDVGGHPVFEKWVIHGAGHAWSGGSPAGSYTDPLGPDATREMVRFFFEQPRPQAIGFKTERDPPYS